MLNQVRDKNKICGFDIETAPLPEFTVRDNFNKDFFINEEDDEEDNIELHIDEAGLLPWTSKIIGIGVCFGDLIDETKYYTDEKEIKDLIDYLSKERVPLCGHNIAFDYGHIIYHFNTSLNFVADSGVISQCINNSDYIQSFGLKQTVERLYNIQAQDVKIKEYLKIHHKIPEGKYGKYLYLVPQDLISEYCRLDAYYTRKIFTDSSKWLKSDISQYMQLYIKEVELTIVQFMEGIFVDQDGFKKEHEILLKKTSNIENTFLNHPDLEDYIKQVQLFKFRKEQSKLKKKILDYGEFNQKEKNKFNINSKTQLKLLFDFQKLHFDEKKQAFKYPFVNNRPGTKIKNPESPKLGTKFLAAYGIGGKILSNRGELMTLMNHIDRALDESKFDGKIHPQINLLGTKSGRVSGSGVNILATPLADSRYGKHLKIKEDGYSILSADFAALEPTIFAELSGDPLLKYICYEGVGKSPIIRDGLLWIDDMYLSAAYSAEFMRKELNLKLDNWLVNQKDEKSRNKQIRDISKGIVLSSNYSAGPEKIKENLLIKLKTDVPIKQIKEFLDSYWASIPYAKTYKDELERRVKKEGYLINIGGFPLIFYNLDCTSIDGAHKALNRMIQSSANVIMKTAIYYLAEEFEHELKGKQIIPLIIDFYDAMWLKVHNDLLEDVKLRLLNKVLQNVNNTVNFSIKLRLTINTGVSFYDAK